MYDTENTVPRQEGPTREKKRGFRDNPLYPDAGKSTVQHVPIKKIVSHQNAVNRRIVEKYKKKPGRKLPIVHKIAGRYYVEDGNHRIVSKMENGESTVRARVFEMMSRLGEIRLATGDYARKYLIDEPMLARPGDPGYDPGVEREVKAALTHQHPPELSVRAALKVARTRQEEATTLKSGFQKVETPMSGKRFMPMVKIVRPYKKIRGEISRQKRELTQAPKEELFPPEMLPKQTGAKTPARGSDYEGGRSPDLWNREEAGKPTNIKYNYPERQHPHQRTPLTAHEVSVKGQSRRDPMASHLARVEAGVTPNLVQTRENPPKGLSEKYLPRAVEVEERRKAQLIRDTLAHKLRALRTETIQPMRDIRRKYLGLNKTKMSELGKQKLWASSEAMGDFPIAYKPGYQKPEFKINPMVPILPRQGLLSPLKPIAEREVHPRVIHAAHVKLRAALDARTKFHQESADAIRQGIHDRLAERYSKVQSSKLLRETSRRLTNETFHPSKIGLGLEDWQAENLAADTGTSPSWIRSQHKQYSKHLKLTTGLGEEKIRRAVNLSLFKNVAGAPPETPRPTFPIMKSLGKKVGIGAGIVGALGAGAYITHRIRQRRKETQFSVPSPGGRAYRSLQAKLKGSLGHEIAVGAALTGGITAADAATSAIFPGKRQTRKEAAQEGAKRGAIYGSVLSGVEPLIRIPLTRKLHHMSSILKEIQFQKWATLHFEDPDIPSPWNRKKRLTVAQDRYRKVIKDREIQRHEANLGKSALAGAAVGALLPKTGKLLHRTAVGAGVGLATQVGAMIHGRQSRDPYGEESIGAKRVQRLPYQAGGLTAAGIAGYGIYKGVRKAGVKKLLFVNPRRPIQFQQFVPAPDETPWVDKEARRWLRHPKSRVENAQKWYGRAKRAVEDYRLPKNEQGQVIDERGRVRTPEYKKPYVKRALITTGAVSALAGVSLLGRHFYKRGRIAEGLLKGGATMSELKPSERLGLNVTSGNWLRAAKTGLREKFPRFSGGVSRLGGLRSEFAQAREGVYKRINTAIEGKVGAITGVEMKRDKTGKELGMQLINPAKVKEEQAKQAVKKAKLERGLEEIRRRNESIIARQKTRGAMEKLLKPPEEQLSSRVTPIRFAVDDEPGYVKVKPHYRQPRSPEPFTKKKKFRESALIGAGIAGTGIGLGGGIALHATRQSTEQKVQREVLRRLEEIAASKAVHGLRTLSAVLDEAIAI